ERVGRHDQFFELGGHSLLVVTLIERLRQQSLHTDIRTIFANPILSAIARALADNDHAASVQVVPPNLITPTDTAITPDMLPLVSLSQTDIDQIIAHVPQGISNIQDIYPLAPLQEGILFHHLLETEGDTYLLRSVLAFDHRARLDVFLSALQSVIDRHDILRTSIHWMSLSQPVQVVLRRAPLLIEELTLLADGDAQAQLNALTDPRHLRLDLQQAPLLKAYIAADPHSQEWYLALLNHHLVCDHVTLEFVVTEVQTILRGKEHQLPPALPYRNFIAQVLSVPVSEHEAYFKQQLGDIEEPTAPFGIFDVQGNGSEVQEARLPLSDELSQRIRHSARQQGVTPAVLFHVAWAQVLAQCCNQDDIVFGTVLSGRLQGSEGADQVLGMFINTLPIRIHFAQQTAQQLVADIYERLGTLVVYEQASLALAQRCSSVAAPLPLFTSMLNYRHSAAGTSDTTEARGNVWEGVRILHGEERTNYPLTLSVDDLGQGFTFTTQCVTGIDAERMNTYLLTAIEGLVHALLEQSVEPVRRLSVLPAAER
ncbi:condensation domain-containing protein, partial [Massilia pseudoviolaceinigra]|uniref:condensation domain-containing protein n=1 Tax=Massilia pseudoviolaceinigra TaxID=3057165 RepID=UPI002796940C